MRRKRLANVRGRANVLQPRLRGRNHTYIMHKYPLLTAAAILSLSALLAAPAYAGTEPAAASSSAEDALPDAPTPQTTAQGTTTPALAGTEGHQTKRILGIIPNFRSVSADQKLPPQSFKEKFVSTAEDSFDYSAVVFAGVQAAVAQVQGSYPEFHQGAAGYGRYFWHTFADQTSENFFVAALLPAALHEDSRYYTKGHGGIVKRGAYAFSRIAITRTDSGDATPNISEVVGAGASSGVSSLYYPTVYRTWTKVGQRWLTNVIIDGATLTAREFWPDINNAVFHQKD